MWDLRRNDATHTVRLMKATQRRVESTGYRLNRQVVERVAEAAGLSTADDIAAHFGIDRSTYFRLLKGDSVPKLDTALEMAAAANVALTELFIKAA